jgi:competence protein ComEA
MKLRRFFNVWSLAAALLVLAIITSGSVIASKVGQSQPLEITLEPAPVLEGEIYVGGEVNNPGIYRLRGGDTIEDILRAAGGPTDGAAPGRVELIIPGPEEAEAPQKVDINRAEAWLLAALPGIGEVRAQAIIDYRRQHGPFRDINELLKVAGMGEATFEGIKDLITVAE